TVATELSGQLTIGLPSVSAWKRAAPVLRELGAHNVLVAYDADASTNKQVARGQLHLLEHLQKEEFAVALERWPIEQGKGMDDLLAAGEAPDCLTGAAAIAAAQADLAQAEAAEDTPPAAPRRKQSTPDADGGVNEADDDPHRLARLFLGQEEAEVVNLP